jgi:Uri superfamily endonuclease
VNTATLKARRGTYALLLSLRAPSEIRVGRLGRLRFDSPYYLYFGSALGPGGLGARIGRHMQTTGQRHWHIDYLRQLADVVGVWYCIDPARLECEWADAAVRLDNRSSVPRFGSSDCRCRSHLISFDSLPCLSDFQRTVDSIQPRCRRIRHI